MGDLVKGTEITDSLENLNDWCIISEAECVDRMDTLSDLFERDTDDSNISNLIDDLEPVNQGNSLALFNDQVAEDCDNAVLYLKRKFIASPERSLADLSPRLQAVHISPQRISKKRLFQDSGIADDETSNSVTQVDSVVQIDSVAKNGASQEEYVILHSSNRKATLLTKFKEKYNVSFNELTRNFKSDKTCTNNWIVVLFAVAEELIEASKIILQQHCEFIQVVPSDFSALYALQFKSTKNRETVIKLFTSMLNISEMQLLCDPPRVRSTPVALYFVKKQMANIGFKYGSYPAWIASQTLVNHQTATAESFKLSDMVQWAYDNDYTEESSIAYFYALHAEQDANAAAFLQSNLQVKYVRDCAQMVKMYKRQELKNMTMSEWIFKCCGSIKEGDGWKVITKYLKYQNVNILSFLIALKLFFQGIPKKTCIVIYGPPDTGKSWFCFKLIKFLQGKVVSFMNRSSHFWLMPLLDGKVGFLDDATHSCWSFLDSNMRNAFDGTCVSVDVKHKALQQMKLPPMFVTTNVDVPKEPSLMYLYSRLTCFEFPNKMPLDDVGNPLFNITNDSWAMFFRKFSRHLELCEDECSDSGDTGEPGRAFCCRARNSIDSN